jgi:hypothetical protein
LCFRLYSNRPVTCEKSVHYVRFIGTQHYQKPSPGGANLFKVDTKKWFFTRVVVLCLLRAHMETFIILALKEEVNKYTT